MARKHNGLPLLILFILTCLPASGTARDARAENQEVGTYRWQDGCVQEGQVCGSVAIKDGLALMSLTAHGVRVDIVLVDTGKMMLVATAVGNSTKHPIFILPEQFSLLATGPKPRRLKMLDLSSMTRKEEKDPSSDNTLIMTATGLATSEIGVNTGLSAASQDQRSRGVEKAGSVAEVLRNMPLRAENIPPQMYVAGVICFETDKQVNQLLLSVPAGGYVFEFPFVRQP